MLTVFFGIAVVLAGVLFGNLFVVVGGFIVTILGALNRKMKSESTITTEAEEITYKHTLLPQEQPPDQTRMPMSATTPGLSINFGGVVESAEPNSEKHRKRVLGTK